MHAHSSPVVKSYLLFCRQGTLKVESEPKEHEQQYKAGYANQPEGCILPDQGKLESKSAEVLKVHLATELM